MAGVLQGRGADSSAERKSHRVARSAEILKEFVRQHGIEALTRKTRADGFHLGHWVSMRRRDYKRGCLPDWLRRELEAIPGWSWDPVADRYRKSLALLRKYAAQHGLDRLCSKTVYRGARLGVWVTCRRVDYRKGRLPEWVARELESIPGWTWEPLRDRQRRKVELLRRYVEQHGWEQFTSRTEVDGVHLGCWVNNRRMDYRSGRLPDWLKKALETIPGWRWGGR